MKALASAALAFAGGCVVSVALWIYWTPRCNEACPRGVALGMLVFAGLFPALCALAAVAGARSPANRLHWLLGVLLVGGAVVAWLTGAAAA